MRHHQNVHLRIPWLTSDRAYRGGLDQLRLAKSERNEWTLWNRYGTKNLPQVRLDS